MTARDRTILAVLLAIAAVVAPWVLVISPKRDHAAKLQSQINSVQSQLTSLRAQAAQAQTARIAFSRSYTTVVRLGEAVPPVDNTPSLIFQIQAAATAAGVDFLNLTMSSHTGGTGPSSASSAASATSAVGATAAGAGFAVEPLTFTFQGNFFHLADFFGRLQRFVVASNNQLSVSGRLMTLNSITLGPGAAGFPQIAATVSASSYKLPVAPGLLNGASPAGPSSAPSQTVSTPGIVHPPPPAVVAAPVR